ncbi:cytochrome P450 [Marasmius fiardii PR-910]|nr:cytochrome P450 [Marasmius fiardii PR-910]
MVMTMSISQLFNPVSLSIATLALTVLLYRHSRKSSFAQIRGPSSPSFLIGNIGELLRAQGGEADLQWQSEFGDVVRFKAPFGEDRLLISDPKAIKRISQGYRWGNCVERRARSLVLAGPSIIYTEGDDHKRHRKIMTPAFAGAESKALVPVFFAAAASITKKWREVLSVSQSQSEVFNVYTWASRATFDALGHGAFGHDFGAIENKDSELSKAYKNLLTDMYAAPSDGMIIENGLVEYLPLKVVSWMLEYTPNVKIARGRATRDMATEVARQMVSAKSEDLAGIEGNKDLISLLIKANMSEHARNRLSEKELLAQIIILFLGGLETTANTLSWTLLELCRQPEMQTKLRQEIYAKKRELAREGRVDFTAEDLESLPYLVAIVKESLRCDPVVIHILKMAMEDDCIPLSQPIITQGGEKIDQIPVRKGQKVVLSVPGYNRNKAVFGEDAHIFKPERWLEKSERTKGPSIGMYANLMTFSAGVQSCMGWRFAVLELQAFIVELIGNFEFTLTPECDKIRKEYSRVVVPTLEGELSKGVQCPLWVRCAKTSEE